MSEQLRVWERVQAANGEIVVLREGIDTTTASGRLHRNLLLSVDAHERIGHTNSVFVPAHYVPGNSSESSFGTLQPDGSYCGVFCSENH